MESSVLSVCHRGESRIVRRLLSFLTLPAFGTTFRALIKGTDEFFSASRLRLLAHKRRWDDALGYLSRHLPPEPDPHRRGLTVEAHVLFHFIRYHGIIAKIAAGDKEAVRSLAKEYQYYQDHCSFTSNGPVWLRSIILSILHSLDTIASMDWAHVTPWAAFMVEGQALAIPELSRLPRLPNSNILAPGFGFLQKRHAKTQPRKSPADVAKAFHERRMRQFVRSERTGSVQTVGLSPMVHEKLALALAKSLEFANGVRQLLPDGTKAWSFPYIYQHCGLPPVAVPNCRAPVSPTIKLTIHGENAAISSVKNAGAPAAPASRINLGVSADCNKNSGMSSLTTAGAAAPVSPAMKLAGCTENTSITSVTNAGFSVAPVCGSMIWTRCAEKSGISSVTTAGTKQSQDVGCHAESARRGPIPRKRLMMEQICADQDFVPKKQRRIGGFTVVTLPETDAKRPLKSEDR